MSNSHTALLVIDMQPDGFVTAKCEKTVNACCKEIKKAVEKDMPIIVLEYVNNGETHRKLRYYLDVHRKTRYIKKRNDDGSDEVIECLKDAGWSIKTFIVCGVNTAGCVEDTITPLVKKYKKQIQLIRNACNSNMSDPFDSAIFRHRKVVLV